MDPDMEGTLQQQLQEKVCDTHTCIRACTCTCSIVFGRNVYVCVKVSGLFAGCVHVYMCMYAAVKSVM